MRKLSTIGLLCGVLAGCTTPAASQTGLITPATDVPPCRTVTGTADIDGTPQQISGLACRQPDGSWQIMQGNNDTLVYPVAWPDTIDYYGAPWYGDWPPFFGGATVIFVDHFHHFHHMDHVHAGGPGMHMGGTHAGFHGGVQSGTVWSGAGSTGGMGGGQRR
jgi:hypothetical protein